MVGSRGQYKIQQMAFMILAIFFFFVLVGLFFVGWLYANFERNVAQLQEEKALSALKVIADSTELNCDSSEDWCIDRDKLTAFREYSSLYQDYWSIASIELLIVYPPRGERVLTSVPSSSHVDVPSGSSCPSTTDTNGDGTYDYFDRRSTVSYVLEGTMGRLDHQSSSASGNARPPIQVYDSLVPGEQIFIEDVTGSILYGDDAEASCLKASGDGGYGGVVGGFYTADDTKILERPLVEFTTGQGVTVPQSASRLYFYVIESNEFSFDYLDNTGSCSFSIGKYESVECSVGPSDSSGSDDSFDFAESLDFSSSSSLEPILCPGPGCDYYVLYDSGQVNKQTFSAYVTVCEQIDRSHEICELAKLLLGVKISDEGV